MNDQANSLRKLVTTNENHALKQPKSTRIVTVTSGKGGVGKSNFSLNFALMLQQRGHKVLVFDADIGMANIDVLMGISAPYNLYHLLKREKTIWEIIQHASSGIDIIAGGSGFRDLVELPQAELDYFGEQIARLSGHYDVILFDTGAGLSKETVKFIAAAQETIVVTTPEPTSITDAYALMKMVKSMYEDVTFKLVVNRASDMKEGKFTADKLAMVAKQFLQMEIPLLGTVMDDANVTKAVKKQVPFVLAYPGGEAARCIDLIAIKFLNESRRSVPAENGLKGFISRMLGLKKG
ncbi:MinD/ParA family protein [Paenibacillus sp. GCM10012307]|uniref:MinD/ParA family protein n=1 Tax=Paenibacillus roseus TaxID=2798579 RepID=A0A934JA22_9BACL|nr:MinD/ParA family protein [Paenibacillus roseus]MBJ6363396.1 MinD/ParA family protein [Paenibacillus roseus]